jgi:signal transduction histidine kinase
VRIDARRLRQVLMNLLGNAVKFTDVGSVTMSVAPAPHPHHAEPYPAESQPVRFLIEDTGMGIEPADLPLIMTPFHQSAEASRKKGGTGLGLAICAELLRRMGADLHAQSALGAGSTFWFDLPLTPAEPPPDAAEHEGAS